MITPADVLEVMTVVAACHHRTAPRMDDEQERRATARVWSEVFDGYDFTTAELVTAVKTRAKVFADAPEPADVIRVARMARSDRMARDWPAESESNPYGVTWHEHYPGDAKAAPDPADYPLDWDSTQRTTMYWYALRLRVAPHTTAGWVALAAQLERKRAERAAQANGDPSQVPPLHPDPESSGAFDGT